MEGLSALFDGHGATFRGDGRGGSRTGIVVITASIPTSVVVSAVVWADCTDDLRFGRFWLLLLLLLFVGLFHSTNLLVARACPVLLPTSRTMVGDRSHDLWPMLLFC